MGLTDKERFVRPLYQQSFEDKFNVEQCRPDDPEAKLIASAWRPSDRGPDYPFYVEHVGLVKKTSDGFSITQRPKQGAAVETIDLKAFERKLQDGSKILWYKLKQRRN